MRKITIIFALAAFLGGISPAGAAVLAQARTPEIADALSRLKNNPRYQGRILGTHIKRDGGRYLYEVRILRPDDRVILVYIDPQTGGVVADSERSRIVRPSRPDGGRQNRDFGDRRRGFAPPVRRGLR